MGDRCRKARESAELDQEELAAAVDVTRQTISNYETGATQRVKALVLKRWALACAVPYSWLETGAEPDSGPDGPSINEESSFACTRFDRELSLVA